MSNGSTSHIQSRWLSVAARLQQTAVQQRKHAILTISVLVDEGGTPLCWTEPRMVKLEPKSQTEQLIEVFREYPALLDFLTRQSETS